MTLSLYEQQQQQQQRGDDARYDVTVTSAVET